MDPRLFPQLPEVASLTVEELTAALAEHKTVAKAIMDRSVDLSAFSEMTDEERAAAVVEQFRAGVVEIRAIEDELTARQDAEANTDAELASIAEGVSFDVDVDVEVDVEEGAVEGAAGTDPADPDPADPADPEADPDAAAEPVAEEVVTASAEPRRMALPIVVREHGPRVEGNEMLALLASAGIPDVREGMPLSREQLATAFINKWRQTTSVPAGFRENVVIASSNYGDAWPDELKLTGDAVSDSAKIEAQVGRNAVGVNPETGEEALLASGGICAPPTPLYEVAGFGSQARPVRNALPGFNATRGGISVAGGVTIADIDTEAVGIVTAAEDEIGGTTGAKSCGVLTCPPFTDTVIEAIYACLTFGNFNARTWPEVIDRWVNETMTWHARVAETELLDGIAAASTETTQDKKYGALSTILMGTLQAAAGMRSRHRTDPNLRLQAFLPQWLPDLLLADLMHSEVNRLDVSREGITALLRKGAIEPVWYMDGATGAGQVFDAQSDGVDVDEFPDTVVGYLFPAGSFLFLDGGTLDLGLVRDSVLNVQNDYQTFLETFENVAFVGVESIEITFTICPDGTTAPKGTAITC